MGDLEMISDAMVESHPWRRPTGKYGLFVNWGLELPGRGPGGGANIRTMVAKERHAPSTLGLYSFDVPRLYESTAATAEDLEDVTAEDMWRTGGYGEGEEIPNPYAHPELPSWLSSTSDAPSFTGDLGIFTSTSKKQKETLASHGRSVGKTLVHEAFHRGVSQVGVFVRKELEKELSDLENFDIGFVDWPWETGDRNSRIKELKEELDLFQDLMKPRGQHKYLSALDTLEGRGGAFKKLKKLSQKHTEEVEEGIEDGPAQEASTKAQAEVQETLDNLERAQNIALRYLPRYRGEALGLNAGGSVDPDSDLIDITQSARPDPRVDEDWPLKDRDFYEIRGQMVWPWEVEGFLKRIAEEEEAAYGPVSKSHKAIEDTIAEKGIAGAFKQFQKNEAGYAADDTLLRMQDLLDEQLVQDEDLLSDLQLEHAGRDLSDQDVMHVLTQQGLTVEEAMRFLSEMSSDSSRSWEDMLESFLASLREESS